MKKFRITKENIIGALGFKFLFWCIPCLSRKEKSERLFEKATNMLSKELDVIELLKGVNKSKLLLSSLLSRRQ